MAEHSDIEWTDATWQIITGCRVLSPGCINCYAMSLAGTRLRNHPSRVGLTTKTKTGPVWTGQVRFNEQWLTQPLQWKRPRRIFVCAHGDLFHEDVPDAWLDKVFAVMALAPQHTFQVLTKRAKRMREYLYPNGRIEIWERAVEIAGALNVTFPLPNVWLGVSAERQQEANERIPYLLGTPAAVRFVSLEPLLGPIDLEALHPDGVQTLDALSGLSVNPAYTGWSRLDLVIAGGESGGRARPMHPAWPRAIARQCADAGVSFFFKQWGSWAPSTPDEAKGNPHSGWLANAAHPHVARASELYPEAGASFVARIGKKRAGRLLDGVEHNGMPERAE